MREKSIASLSGTPMGLLMVQCSDKATQAVMNTGTLYRLWIFDEQQKAYPLRISPEVIEAMQRWADRIGVARVHKARASWAGLGHYSVFLSQKIRVRRRRR